MRSDPHTAEEAGHTVIERPPPGLARGRYPVPAWMVLTLGAVLVLGALVYFAWRVRRRARR
jgi:uncharacterized membrane protein